ncbi:MAG: TetR/AcrR family transcriptional regulator [Steroidobacteraceae bacterium]
MRPKQGKRAYRSPKRDSAAGKTRARIIAAANKQLRSAKGLQSLSLESVAAQAGVTRLTLYNQFGSRRGLLEAVFDDVAFRGGLHRLPEAMAEQDPRAALQRLVGIFCEFWYFNRHMLGRIIGAGVADRRLQSAMRARNERRRKLLAVIIKRLQAAGRARPEVCEEVVDVLFVLTSHAVFAGLADKGRSVEAVCRLVQNLAISTLDRLDLSS